MITDYPYVGDNDCS